MTHTPLKGLSFHHVGMAVYAIEDAFAKLQSFGYSTLSKTYVDPKQKINIAFVSSQSQDQQPRLELIEPSDKGSIVDGLLKKNGSGIYHLGFICSEFESSVVRLEDSGYSRLADPSPSPAFAGRPFCFFYHRSCGLLELIGS